MKKRVKTAITKTKNAIKNVLEKVRSNKKAVRAGSIGLVVLGLAIIAYPFIPAFLHLINPPEDFISPYQVEEPEKIGISEVESTDTPTDNRLVIPSIGVDARILEGDTISVLTKEEGVWHEPSTGDPETGGNMVISGHRFQYLPPNMVTFYHLDKVETEDTMIIYWKDEEYDFKVTEILTVEPDQVEIRDSTPGKTEITVYTCTPLWKNTHRLVVKGTLI